MYHAVRAGYAAGWYPDGTGRWDESVDTGDVYGQLASTLGLENTGSGYQKISNGSQICAGILKKFRFPNRLTPKGVVLSNQEINQEKEENQ